MLCQDWTWTNTLFHYHIYELEVDLWLMFGEDFLLCSESRIFISNIFLFQFQCLAKLCPLPQTWKLKNLETPLALSRTAST